MNKPPIALPPAPLHPGHMDLYDTDVFIVSMEGVDVYWAPTDNYGNEDKYVILVSGESPALAAFSIKFGWQNDRDIPESVKRFAESIYHLHA